MDVVALRKAEDALQAEEAWRQEQGVVQQQDLTGENGRGKEKDDNGRFWSSRAAPFAIGPYWGTGSCGNIGTLTHPSPKTSLVS